MGKAVGDLAVRGVEDEKCLSEQSWKGVSQFSTRWVSPAFQRSKGTPSFQLRAVLCRGGTAMWGNGWVQGAGTGLQEQKSPKHMQDRRRALVLANPALLPISLAQSLCFF